MRWATLTVVFCSLFCSAFLAESNETPSLKIMARSSVYNVGEKKGIYCEGTNIAEQIEWMSPTGEIVQGRSTKNTRVYVERRNSEPNVVALIIHSTKLSDRGNWTCKAGDISESIEVIVGEKVMLAESSEDVQADEGKSVKLNCEAKGNPKPVVQWYKEGVPIDEDPRILIRKKEDTYTLEIKRLTHADAGEYMCKVTQKALSHYTHKTVNLIVHHKPILFNAKTREIIVLDQGNKFRTEETYAVINETKTLTCSALAYPPPKFSWFKRKSNYDEPIRDEELISSNEPVSSTLTLRRMEEDDMGQYKCTASNDKGQISVLYDVSPGQKPEPPQDIQFYSANNTYITFNVTCGSNCTYMEEAEISVDASHLPIIGYTFGLVPHREEYPADWDNSSEFYVEIVDPEVTLFDVGPLPNTTVFHVRVNAANSAGFSEWLEMQTLPSTTSHDVRLVASFLLLNSALIITMCN